MGLNIRFFITVIISGAIGYGISASLHTAPDTTAPPHNRPSDIAQNSETDSSGLTLADIAQFHCRVPLPQEKIEQQDSLAKEAVVTSEKNASAEHHLRGMDIIASALSQYGYRAESLTPQQWRNFVAEQSTDYWTAELDAGSELLNLAVIKQNTPMIKRLLTNHVDVESTTLLGASPFQTAAKYANLDDFKLMVGKVKNLNDERYDRLIKWIKKENQPSLAQAKIEYLFNQGYVFDNMNLQVLPLLSYRENLTTPELVNALSNINPNAPIFDGRNVMLTKMIVEGANDDTVTSLLPYFDAENLSREVSASLLISSVLSNRIQHSSTIRALIAKGVDVNAYNYGSPSILMSSILAVQRAKSDAEFKMQKQKIAALIQAGADRKYIDNQGNSALSILEKITAKPEYKQQIRALLD